MYVHDVKAVVDYKRNINIRYKRVVVGRAQDLITAVPVNHTRRIYLIMLILI